MNTFVNNAWTFLKLLERQFSNIFGQSGGFGYKTLKMNILIFSTINAVHYRMTIKITLKIINHQNIDIIWFMQVPLAIFKREKEVARKLEFDGMWIVEQPTKDDLQNQWDRLAISTR